jgi:hypothetical protein
MRKMGAIAKYLVAVSVFVFGLNAIADESQVLGLVHNNTSLVTIAGKVVELHVERALLNQDRLYMKNVRTGSGAFVADSAAVTVCNALGFNSALARLLDKASISLDRTEVPLLWINGYELKYLNAKVAIDIECLNISREFQK